MQNKKVTMLAAVLAVTVIAMAGVGYAAVQYTASTTNTENAMDVTYMTMVQDGTAEYSTKSFLTDLYFNSVNKDSASNIKYIPVTTGYLLSSGAYSETDTSGTAVAKISEQLKLKIKPTDATLNKIKMEVKATEFTPTEGLEYTLILTHGNVSDAIAYDKNAKSWTFTTLAISGETEYEVTLVVGLKENVEEISEAKSGFPASGAATKSTFTFTATAEPVVVTP